MSEGDAIQREDIEELIEEWREEGELFIDSDIEVEALMASQQLRCAAELEELIEND